MDVPASQETPPPAHAGLLREEVLALRKLFGYIQHDCTSSDRLVNLDLAHALSSSNMRDVLLVAFDVDTRHSYELLARHDLECHIGISILDTRSIRDMISAPASDKTAKVTTAIQSYHYNVGETSKSKYMRRAAKKFLFGEADAIRRTDLKAKFEDLIGNRQMVLVFHGGSASDWTIFKSLELGQQPLFVLDTVKAAQHPLRLSYRLSLEKLLEVFEVPFDGLHAAGNDAHFCLRALLMIAVKDAEGDGKADTKWIQVLTHIARQPLPSKPDPEPDAATIALEARRREKQEAKDRHKAKRAAKIERRRLERETQAGAGDVGANIL